MSSSTRRRRRATVLRWTRSSPAITVICPWWRWNASSVVSSAVFAVDGVANGPSTARANSSAAGPESRAGGPSSTTSSHRATGRWAEACSSAARAVASAAARSARARASPRPARPPGPSAATALRHVGAARRTATGCPPSLEDDATRRPVGSSAAQRSNALSERTGSSAQRVRSTWNHAPSSGATAAARNASSACPDSVRPPRSRCSPAVRTSRAVARASARRSKSSESSAAAAAMAVCAAASHEPVAVTTRYACGVPLSPSGWITVAPRPASVWDARMPCGRSRWISSASRAGSGWRVTRASRGCARRRAVASRSHTTASPRDDPGEPVEDGGRPVGRHGRAGELLLDREGGLQPALLLLLDQPGDGPADRDERHGPRHGEQRQAEPAGGGHQRRGHLDVRQPDPEPDGDRARPAEPIDVAGPRRVVPRRRPRGRS